MARSFSSTDCLLTTNNVTQTFGVPYTLTGWTNITGGAGTIRCLMRSLGGLGLFGLYVNSNNKLSLLDATLFDTTFSPTIGTWFHWAITYSPNVASSEAVLVNGSSVLSGHNGTQTEVGTFKYGNDGFGQPLIGNMADIVVWENETLNADELTALTLGIRPMAIKPKKQTLWCPIDGLQSPESDLSGNANNGILTGTAFAPGPPITMFTPRRPAFLTPSLVTTVFRKTLSSIGTRTGSRQTWAA